MPFTSFHFLVFFAVASLGYFYLPRRHRWLWLLLASVYFYMVFIPIYIVILLFTVVVNYFAAILMERNRGGKRKLWFVSALVLEIGVLAFFKYANFIGQNLGFLNSAFANKAAGLNIIAPLGVSFYTFMSISYLIEVYSGRLKAERQIGYLALFVMFFPAVVAGPIERPQNTIPQFKAPQEFEYERVSNALKLMAFGFFKKLVIADRLALIVNNVYGHPANFSGPQLILATFLFSFQIYCDFSGYSDIAIGAAQVLGIRLMDNFKQPYFSRSVTEFWQRWHISLSTWLRDYLYYPIARRLRLPNLRWIALLLTFLISGIWHGAAWTFVIWGAIHGIYLCLELWAKGWGQRVATRLGLTAWPRMLAFIQIALTFCAISFAWIFFRANSTGDALYIISNLGNGVARFLANLANFTFLKDFLIQMGLNPSNLTILVLALCALIYIERLQTFGSVRAWLAKKPGALRWAFYYALIGAIVFLGVYGSSGFIYFQF